MTNMHNHPETASYIMFEDGDCPYCKIVELEKQNAKLVEALETLSKLGSGDKVGNSIGNQIAAAALKEMEVGRD